MDKTRTELSKLLAYVLRHAPGELGLTLGEGGWVATRDLIARAQAAGHPLTDALLREIVAANDKKRFTLSEDGAMIRAAQGHSVAVSLALAAVTPPETLYHGTATRFLDAIMAEGLKPQARHQVHLSGDVETARKVGMRHGKPAILHVAAGLMHEQGFSFYRADNGVWLTDHVPAHYLTPRD